VARKGTSSGLVTLRARSFVAQSATGTESRAPLRKRLAGVSDKAGVVLKGRGPGGGTGRCRGALLAP